jgi:Na+/proline symporter
MMSMLSVERPIRWPKPMYLLALALLTMVFGLFVPFLAYELGALRADFDLHYPRLASLIIDTSPWTAWLIAILGIVALTATERLCGEVVSRRTNIAAIASTALLGAIACVILFLPLVTTIEPLHQEARNAVGEPRGE